MKVVFKIIIGVSVLISIATYAEGKEVPFTLEDRERLIRLEVTLKEFKEAVDKRFEQIDRRFEQVDRRFEQVDKRFEQVDKRFEDMNKRFEDIIAFMSIITGIFTAIMIANIGFAYWDRRTIIRKAKMESVEEIEKSGKLKDIIYALRDLAKKNPDVAEILQKFHLL